MTNKYNTLMNWIVLLNGRAYYSTFKLDALNFARLWKIEEPKPVDAWTRNNSR
jgi:hypothetical protein